MQLIKNYLNLVHECHLNLIHLSLSVKYFDVNSQMSFQLSSLNESPPSLQKSHFNNFALSILDLNCQFIQLLLNQIGFYLSFPKSFFRIRLYQFSYIFDFILFTRLCFIRPFHFSFTLFLLLCFDIIICLLIG